MRCSEWSCLGAEIWEAGSASRSRAVAIKAGKDSLGLSFMRSPHHSVFFSVCLTGQCEHCLPALKVLPWQHKDKHTLSAHDLQLKGTLIPLKLTGIKSRKRKE